MKNEFYKKMEPMFHLIEHKYKEVSPIEIILLHLARGNTFNMRVVGLEGVKKFRKENADSSITFKPNHFSEADFVMLALLFRENDMRVLTEGGSNLFLDNIDIFRDLMPLYVEPHLKEALNSHSLSISQYLSERGAFKVFREPTSIKQNDGSEIQLGIKDILSLMRTYRYHLVKEREMYVTFPGYSSIKADVNDPQKKNGFKTGRSYTGKIDGYHHLPFQMDIEASLYTDVDVYVVDVNIAYVPVLEDENFGELARLHKEGASQDDIYRNDLGYIMNRFCSHKNTGEMSIKFGKPFKIDVSSLKEGKNGRKIKDAAYNLASDTFVKSISMQPVFPANIYFTAFDKEFNGISIEKFREKIDLLRAYLKILSTGEDRCDIDLHYILDYNNQIISVDEIINRTFHVFNSFDKRITSLKEGIFVVDNKDVAQQYRNHTSHFFEAFPG